VNKLASRKEIEPYYEVAGENPFTIYRFVKEPDVLIVHGQVGCPACGGNLDLFNAFGVTKVMFCGGGGVLDRNIKVGQLLLVEGAIRDEGFSYHYVEQAGCIAVAQFRGFDYGAIIYGGDDVASEEWTDRGWNTREGIRYNLVTLCKEIVLEL